MFCNSFSSRILITCTINADFFNGDMMRHSRWVNQLLPTVFLHAVSTVTAVPQPNTVKPETMVNFLSLIKNLFFLNGQISIGTCHWFETNNLYYSKE